MSSTHVVPVVPSGVKLLSRATYISRRKRNRETCWLQSMALKRVQCEAKRKLVAQPEISHEDADFLLRSQAARSEEKFLGIIHVSHQLALLHGHENVVLCTQCGAVNAGGSLRLLKSLCDGSGVSRQKARRKPKRVLMPNEHVVADAKRTFQVRAVFLDVAGWSDLPCIVNLISHQINPHTRTSHITAVQGHWPAILDRERFAHKSERCFCSRYHKAAQYSRTSQKRSVLNK